MTAAVAPDWTTADLPVVERADGVREALGRTHLPWELDFRDDAPVECQLTTHDLADGALVECRSGLLGGRRRPGRTGIADEHVGLLVVLEGREQVRQGEVAVDLRAGDALLWRSGLPASFRVLEPLHKLTLLLPAERLVGVQPGPVELPASRAMTGLLTSHLRALAGLARQVPAAQTGFVVDVALDLLRRAVRPASDHTSRHHRLVRDAVSIIEASLDDPSLSPGRIADRLGVSPRWLHAAFAETEETVSATIRRRRLERVRRDLADPAMAGATITTIAFRWGFTDAATLSRQFRRTFGTTPSAYRATGR